MAWTKVEMGWAALIRLDQPFGNCGRFRGAGATSGQSAAR
jgi:hypothetical protein